MITAENIKADLSEWPTKLKLLFFRDFDFTVRRPKTDVCDFCTECEKLEHNPDHPCLTAYKLHKKKVEKYLLLKNEYIKKC